jgi:glycosyltransferase involved in cell wall biosynthesis
VVKTTRASSPGDHLVIIDATAIPSDRSGVGRYLDGLIAALGGPFAIACQQADADYYRALAPDAIVLPQHPSISSVPARLLWEQFRLPSVAKRVGARVIHSPHYTSPLFSRLRRVVTFHDATFFSDPHLHTRLKRTFFRTWIRLSARLADAIIVPSQATADELLRYQVHGSDRYVVAYHGVDQTLFHVPTIAERRDAADMLGLGDAPWIAFLGTIEPRKNVPVLVAAYRAVVSEWSQHWGAIPTLAIAGGQGWEDGLGAELEMTSSPARVELLGFIDLDVMRGFLGGSAVVCYPSSGEGFGLPVLEAMACGAPVLTTRRLALPEVGGDAVAYSEPNAASLAAALRALIDNPSERARLAEAGRRRSEDFTWANSARTHRRVYAQSEPRKG